MGLDERLARIEREQNRIYSVLKDIMYMIVNIQSYLSVPRKTTEENEEFVEGLKKKCRLHGIDYIKGESFESLWNKAIEKFTQMKTGTKPVKMGGQE